MDLLPLGLGLAGGALLAKGAAALREHRAQPASLADLLGWGFLVDEGVVLQKDGALLAAWRYRGPDLGAATGAELDALAEHVNAALLPMAGAWVWHVDAVRRPAQPYAAGAFPDPVTALLDEERREAYARDAGRQYETEHVVAVTYAPPPDLATRAAGWFVQDGDGAGAARTDGGALLGGFAAALAQLEDRLAGRLHLERLGSDALCTHLHECLTGLAHPVAAPAHGAYLNAVLSDQDLVGGFAPKVGAHHVRVVALQGYPAAAAPGLLDVLNRLPFAYRWSSRIIPLGRADAAKLIRRQALQWFRKRKGAAQLLTETAGRARAQAPGPDADLWQDQDARAMTRDAQTAAAANEAGAVRFCLHTQVVVVSDPDAARADTIAREVLRAVTDVGITGRVESVNALDAFLGSLPGHGHANLRRALIPSRAVVCTLPLTSVWPGLAENPSPYFPAHSPPLLWARTDGSTPFRVNLHVSDVGHTLVIGATGAGKSVLLTTLAAQWLRYPAAQVFYFDVGGSAWPLAQAAGARHYELAAGHPDALAFQPLARVDDPAERAWAVEWLELLVTQQGVAMTPPLRARLERAVELLALSAPAHRTLSDLAVHLQHADLSAALRPYTVAGPYGALLDADRDDLADGAFQVFELRHLLEIDDRVVVPVLAYLLRRVEQRLDGRPTLLVIDEAWQALMHSAFGARINAWLLQLRKRNAAVVLATQSAAHVLALPGRHTILDSCATKVFLPNPDARTPGAAALYRELGLNAREVALLAEATPKRDYYLRTPRGSRRFDLGLGPVALAFLAAPAGMTPADVRRRIEALMAAHGPAWPAAWLRERGLDTWAERLATRFAGHLNARGADLSAMAAAAAPARPPGRAAVRSSPADPEMFAHA